MFVFYKWLVSIWPKLVRLIQKGVKIVSYYFILTLYENDENPLGVYRRSIHIHKSNILFYFCFADGALYLNTQWYNEWMFA